MSFVVVYARPFVPRERSYGNAQSLGSHNHKDSEFLFSFLLLGTTLSQQLSEAP